MHSLNDFFHWLLTGLAAVVVGLVGIVHRAVRRDLDRVEKKAETDLKRVEEQAGRDLGRVEALANENSHQLTRHRERLAQGETQFRHIAETLKRIEAKIDKGNGHR